MKFGENTNQYVREFLAETLGTFALVIFGDGAVAQVVLGNAARGDTFFGGFLNISFGYGLALMIGICISGGVSGGHLNPAVTLAMAAVKNLKPVQVPVYMAGQYLGAFLAALVLWGEYADAIKMVEMNISPTNSSSYTSATHGIFASYPFFDLHQVTTLSLALDQMLGTAMLLIIILAVTDKKNMKIESSLVPLTIGLGLTAIHLSFGLNAGSAINPARDFAPRLLTSMAGWKQPFKAAQSWFWIPWLLPHVGGVVGALIYQFMIDIHHPLEE
eukprot:TRINITY_DN15388_c0_g1_i1.p1 TRINITY_DN15388_c0_g1~~TRINITY_DN15388_c0_g1_i1.p1  ORF type:complete len:273 (+),score=84.77 TRINITY_DN15388_c0_g1_i1:71-889(+)